MTYMDKLIKKSQILNLFLIATLLIITPLLSTSLRSTYLYFIVNILIILVASEAGLLSFFLTYPDQNKKRPNSAVLKPVINTEFSQLDHEVVEKEKIVDAVKEQNEKKSPSTPSIFFIEEEEEINDEGSQEMGEVINGQELFQKAENFIGNFYKQLKMQREESWKKLHELYQKAF